MDAPNAGLGAMARRSILAYGHAPHSSTRTSVTITVWLEKVLKWLISWLPCVNACILVSCIIPDYTLTDP